MPRKIKEAVVKTEQEISGAVRSVADVSQEIINAVMASVKPVKERKKRVLSDEAKDALRERLVKARSVKAEKKAALVTK